MENGERWIIWRKKRGKKEKRKQLKKIWTPEVGRCVGALTLWTLKVNFVWKFWIFVHFLSFSNRLSTVLPLSIHSRAPFCTVFHPVSEYVIKFDFRSYLLLFYESECIGSIPFLFASLTTRSLIMTFRFSISMCTGIFPQQSTHTRMLHTLHFKTVHVPQSPRQLFDFPSCLTGKWAADISSIWTGLPTLLLTGVRLFVSCLMRVSKNSFLLQPFFSLIFWYVTHAFKTAHWIKYQKIVCQHRYLHLLSKKVPNNWSLVST